VPDEISLALSISGCNLGCTGCHSSETWVKTYGEELSDTALINLIEKNKHISCVLIYDGQHNIDRLIKIIQIIKSFNLKTALYTGLDILQPELIVLLDYYKLGKYIKELGGLSKETTNQKLYKNYGNSSSKLVYNFKLGKWQEDC